MRKSLLLSLLLITLLGIAGWTSFGQKSGQSQVTYEYQVIYDPTETGSMEAGLKQLNELGAQGWELVGVSHEKNIVESKLYFRRIKH